MLSKPQVNFDHFCREATLSIGEPMAGTASYAEQYIFLSWPKPSWQHKAMQSVGLPESLGSWLEELNKTRQKTQLRLIHRHDTTDWQVEIFIYPGAHHYSQVPPHQIMTVLSQHFSNQPNSTYKKNNLSQPQLFICTHGRHDKCCAKFGQVVFQEFQKEISSQQANIDLWESTHLGGHRFAATGITFPSSNMYGRMMAEDVPVLVEYILHDRVFAPYYRGKANLSPVEQVAEAFAHQISFSQNKALLVKIQEMKEISDKAIQVNLLLLDPINKLTVGSLSCHLVQKKYIGPLDCEDLAEQKLDHRLRWVVKSEEDIEN